MLFLETVHLLGDVGEDVGSVYGELEVLFLVVVGCL